MRQSGSEAILPGEEGALAGPTKEPRGWRRVAVLVLVAFAARWAAIGNPVVHVDEQFYLTVAVRMLHGAVPYVDVWDRKQIGLFLVYLPAAAFGAYWGVYVYQTMALACVVATAAMIGRLAERAGWARGGLWAGAAYIVWLDLADGQGGQSPVFYTMPVVGAVLLTSGIATGSRGYRRGFGAMVLVGCALQIKFSVVFEGVWIGLWLLWRARAAGARIGVIVSYAAGLVTVALLPTLMVAGWYRANGYWDLYVFANFVSIALRRSDPDWIVRGNVFALIAILAPLVVMAFAGGRSAMRADMRQRMFLWGWLAASLAGVAVFGSYFNHYALPVMAPAATCAAAFAAFAGWRRTVAWSVAGIAFATGQILVLKQRERRGNAGEFYRIVADIGHGPGCLFVYSGESLLYPASGRCSRTKFLFASHLNSEREHGAIGVEQSAEVDRILDLRPAVVVVTSPYPGERLDQRSHVLARLARDGYRVRADDPLGRQRVAIYAPLDARAVSP